MILGRLNLDRGEVGHSYAEAWCARARNLGSNLMVRNGLRMEGELILDERAGRTSRSTVSGLAGNSSSGMVPRPSMVEALERGISSD